MEHPIDGLIETAMKNIKTMVNVDTVIGEPVTAADGTVILPVSTVSFGFGAGGSDFSNKNTTDDKLFGGGCGGGATVKPSGFLIISGGNVRFLPLSGNSGPVDKIIDLVPGMVDKVNGFMNSRKRKKDAGAEVFSEVETID